MAEKKYNTHNYVFLSVLSSKNWVLKGIFTLLLSFTAIVASPTYMDEEG